MSFPIANFIPGLRIVLDDWDPTVPYRYPDTTLTQAVQQMVQLGKLNDGMMSVPVGYTISPDGTGIDPDWSAQPPPVQANIYALAMYETALMFLRPNRSKYSYRTRQVSESFGDQYRYIETMEAAIYKLKNGEAMFSGYQSYYAWLTGIAGLPLGEVLAQFDVESPLWKATFTRDGMRVA